MHSIIASHNKEAINIEKNLVVKTKHERCPPHTFLFTSSWETGHLKTAAENCQLLLKIRRLYNEAGQSLGSINAVMEKI